MYAKHALWSAPDKRHIFVIWSSPYNFFSLSAWNIHCAKMEWTFCSRVSGIKMKIKGQLSQAEAKVDADHGNKVKFNYWNKKNQGNLSGVCQCSNLVYLVILQCKSLYAKGLKWIEAKTTDLEPLLEQRWKFLKISHSNWIMIFRFSL